MKILKFGGSSVANAENIKKVIQIIADASKKPGNLVVVVSALGGVTDQLINVVTRASKGDRTYPRLMEEIFEQHSQIIEKLIPPQKQRGVRHEVEKKYRELQTTLHGVSLLGELSLRSVDAVISWGEQISAAIISDAIKNKKIACQFVDARALITTDDNFGSAHVNIQKTYANIAKYFQTPPKLSLMGGFIASTHEGVTTTLGRGGSDYTASLVGAALQASVIEIWTDVDGVMTADPHKVAHAFPLARISYDEASELAHFGAKVIHPKTMAPARIGNIPIDIKNTFHPHHKGTRISNETSARTIFLIKGISALPGISLLRVQSNSEKKMGEIAARIFDTIARAEIEILLTTQASHEPSLSVAVHSHQAQKAKTAIEKNFVLELKAAHVSPIAVEQDLSIVAIVGKQMKGVPGISGRLLSTLGNNKINVVAIAQGSSELNVSVVINSQDERRALQAIHESFFESRDPTINLFLIGTGLIGSTLLKQIKETNAHIRLCGVANRHHMLWDTRGITLKNWEKELTRSAPADIQDFIDRMIALHVSRSVVVDCTASEKIAATYEKIIKAGIAIVTPNKKANAGSYAYYQKLRMCAQENKVPFLYETNVGAGLPMIHTLQELVASGDTILKIEAVLSGTLSYIFNTFSAQDKSFSQVVRDAKEKGYTEPDPRDDLRGRDVARKMLILAREIGLKLELPQIKIKPILPPQCFRGNSIDDFFTELKKQDNYWRKKKLQAQRRHHVLRYIATLHAGRAVLALRAVHHRHPSYHLSGSDNIISITTRRYADTPLVIKGPGAGAAVTAGGVLANILRIFK